MELFFDINYEKLQRYKGLIEYFKEWGVLETIGYPQNSNAQRWQLLLEKTQSMGQIGSFHLDLSSNTYTWSDELYRLMGFQKKEHISSFHDYLAVVYEEDRGEVETLFKEAIENGRDIHVAQHRIRRKDNGEIRFLLLKGEYSSRESGEKDWFIGAAQDVTAYVKTERELKEQSLLFRGVIDGVLDALNIQDPHHTVLLYNQAGYSMLEMTPEKAQGKKCYELLGRSRECENCITRKAIQSKRMLSREKYFPEQDKYMDFRSNPILDEEGNVKWVVEHLRDITEQKKSQKKIAEYTSMLEAQSKELKDANKRLDEEMEKAQKVHEQTLPKKIPVIEGLDLYAYYRPANRMGGDFYNVIEYGDSLLLFLSDITGHGLDGAMMNAFVKNMITAYIELLPDNEAPAPSKLLSFLSRQYAKESYPEDYFISILIGLIDLKNNALSYSSAGYHVPPLLFYNDMVINLPVGGMPITTTIDRDQLLFFENTEDLSSKALLFFSTDGLIEQIVGNTIYGDRLYSIIQEKRDLPPSCIGEAINRDFLQVTGCASGDDDITYLIIKTGQSSRAKK